MSRLTRKFVAVLMLLWLPLSGGGALAATVSMQTQHGACDAAMPEMHHADADGSQHHPAGAPAVHDQTALDDQGSSCNSCGVCHLVCSGYLAAPGVDTVAAQAAARPAASYAVTFHSITSAPLLHPPLARA